MGLQPGVQQVDTTCGSLLRELQVSFYRCVWVMFTRDFSFLMSTRTDRGFRRSTFGTKLEKATAIETKCSCS